MGKAPVPVRIQKAIISDSTHGMTTIEIGKKYKLHRVSVSRIINKFKREVPQAEICQELRDWKTELKRKSVDVLNHALTRKGNKEFDPYKAASVAIPTLKGIGEFDNEQPGRGIHVTVVMPQGLKLPNEQEALPVVDVPALPEKADGGDKGKGE
jgi:hypothetical protein